MAELELSGGQDVHEEGAKVFRDPIHDLIYLSGEDRWMLDLIDTKEFQRLRRIRQLGVASLVYPGAEHTRFVHSLGVFNYARKMIRKLIHRHGQESEAGLREELKRYSRVIKTAALLHDLGHGPFSHVFERVLSSPGKRLLKHDEWTCRIMRDSETEIHECLKRHGFSVGEIDQVCSLVCDSEPGTVEPFLKDIVSSQLDADRLDYLQRDSLMTGSQYGKFDSAWVMNALLIGEIDLGEKRVKKLCLDASKGVGAIESMLFARRLMFSYVYGHKTTRAYEAEMIQTLRIALLLGDRLPNETPSPVRILVEKRGDLSTKDYLMLDDEVIWWALRRWAVWDAPLEGDCKELAAALKRHALRLVRRHSPWRTVTIDKEVQVLTVRRFVQDLVDSHSPLQFECYLDTMDDLPYKNYHTLRREKGVEPEEAFFKEILLRGKNKIVEPLSTRAFLVIV